MLKKKLMPSGGDPTWARVCDTCRCSASRVYCTTDAAYLCAACDARIHASAPGHYRVWVCEACENLPAAFVCKADSASLCVDCDAKIHSANSLASRHQRIPISACLYGATPTNNLGSTRMLGSVPIVGEIDDDFDEDDEDEAASWLILNPSNNNNNNNNNNNTKESNTIVNECSVGGEVVDEYLDLVEFDLRGGDNRKLNNDHQHSHHEHHQCTVPIGVEQDIMHNQHSFHMGLEFDHIKTHQYSYNNSFSMPHTMSMSSMDVGVVPESRTSENDLSTNNNTHDHHHQQQQPTIPTQLSPMDREARVQRYREKKKTRKFEKTIRYASRKAYAETRPRIKGRFAKRNTHDDIEANNVMADTGYGVVPSF